jgi:hypothetical protein
MFTLLFSAENTAKMKGEFQMISKLSLSIFLVIAFTLMESVGISSNLPIASAQSASSLCKPLKLYWHPGRQDVAPTVSQEVEQRAVQDGYQFLAEEGCVFEQQGDGMVPLKLYWHPGRQDVAPIVSQAAEQRAIQDGYQFWRVEGYVFEQQGDGMVPLKLYWHPGRQDVASVVSQAAEQRAVQDGYQFWRVEGYVFRDASVLNPKIPLSKETPPTPMITQPPIAATPTMEPVAASASQQTSPQNSESTGQVRTQFPGASNLPGLPGTVPPISEDLLGRFSDPSSLNNSANLEAVNIGNYRTPLERAFDAPIPNVGDPRDIRDCATPVVLNIWSFSSFTDVDNDSRPDPYTRISFYRKQVFPWPYGGLRPHLRDFFGSHTGRWWWTWDCVDPAQSSMPIAIEIWDDDSDEANDPDDQFDIVNGPGDTHELQLNPTTCQIEAMNSEISNEVKITTRSTTPCQIQIDTRGEAGGNRQASVSYTIEVGRPRPIITNIQIIEGRGCEPLKLKLEGRFFDPVLTNNQIDIFRTEGINNERREIAGPHLQVTEGQINGPNGAGSLFVSTPVLAPYIWSFRVSHNGIPSNTPSINLIDLMPSASIEEFVASPPTVNASSPTDIKLRWRVSHGGTVLILAKNTDGSAHVITHQFGDIAKLCNTPFSGEVIDRGVTEAQTYELWVDKSILNSYQYSSGEAFKPGLGGGSPNDDSETIFLPKQQAEPPPIPEPPPLNGFGSVVLYNCHAEKRPLNIWVYSSATPYWQEIGTISHQYNGPVCGPGYSSSTPFTYQLDDGVIYEIIAVDQGGPYCGKNNPLHLGCRRWTLNSIRGQSGGQIFPQVIY